MDVSYTETVGTSVTMGPFVVMCSGQRFYLEHPEEHKFSLGTWRHHLDGINRFGGGSRVSVWTHSVNAAEYAHKIGLDVAHQQALLFHDFEEAILSDRTSPVKKWLGTTARELKAAAAIRSAACKSLCGHGWDGDMDDSMHHVDRVMLNMEVREYMPAMEHIPGLPDPIAEFTYRCPTHTPRGFHTVEHNVLKRCGVRPHG